MIRTLERSPESLRDLKQNWDTYDGLPISEEAILQATQIISLLEALPFNLDVDPCPLANGNIELLIDTLIPEEAENNVFTKPEVK